MELALSHLVVDKGIVEKLGPAVNSSRSLFLYGPPGNGKTSLAEAISAMLGGEAFIPHCLEVDGRNPSGTEATAVHAMCSGALAQSGLRPGDIDLIKVQAAGSPVNDAIEAEALKQVFEPLPPLVSLKSALGHTLGASGAAELALLVGCIEGAAWPAVDYPLDASLGIALSEQVPRRLRNILLNFAGFGGGHASLVLKDTGP